VDPSSRDLNSTAVILCCKKRANCGIPWLTWPCSICKIGPDGKLSGVAVVRTVVSGPFRSLLFLSARSIWLTGSWSLYGSECADCQSGLHSDRHN
jgi:hypothetical protein